MPLEASTIVVTVGSASANSYVSLQAFADYRDLSRITADAFDAAEPDDKIRSLVMAAKRLNRENWQGSRVDETQVLAWPRSGVRKVDGVQGWGAGDYYGFGDVAEYLPTEIPQPVKDAQCELALAFLEGFDDGEEDQIKSFSADGVAVEFRQGRPQGGLPAVVSQLLSGLIQGPKRVRA